MNFRPVIRCLGVAGLLASSGCDREDVDRLGRVGQKVEEKCHAALSGTENSLTAGLEAMKSNWKDTALDTRVTLRLRWEKGMEDTALKVSVEEGTLIIKGTVKTTGQRQTALSVAQATVGVEAVKDEIVVEP